MRILIIAALISSCFVQVMATNYYVAKSGLDSNNGTLSKPYLTINKATSRMVAGDSCFIKEGVYRETVQFSNNGSSGKPIVLTKFESDSVTVSATNVLSNWDQHSGHIYRAKVRMDLENQNMLYCNNKVMDWARWPNNTDDNVFTVQGDSVSGGSSSSVQSVNGFPNKNWVGGYIWYLGAHSGTSWTRQITSQSANSVNFTAIDITKWPFNGHNPTAYSHGNRGRYYLFGVYGALDYEREWYYDSAKDSVYFQAPENANPSTLNIETAQRAQTLNINKNYVVLDGINAFGGKIKISGNNCTLKNGHYLNCLQTLDELDNDGAQAWTGAIHVAGKNVTIEHNTLEGSSINGIFIQGWGGTERTIVSHNYIFDCNSVGIHSTPIRAGGNNHKIISNTIKSAGRDGIYTNGNNIEIAYNDISNCLLINNDGGVYYTVGNANLKNVEIHHNWLHDSYGPYYADGRAAGIYLDNNSKGYNVHHNVVWNVTWNAYQLNWNNTDIDFFNNTLWKVGGATGRWANGYVETDNKVWNNFSDIGDWSSIDFKPNLKTNLIATKGMQDPEALNFVPSPNSDMVDMATVIPGITVEYSGSAPDIGAYEYGIVPWTPGVNTILGGGKDSTITSKTDIFTTTNEIITYPNPLSGEQLTIVFKNPSEALNIEIYNASGRIIKSLKVTDETMFISRATFEQSGLYILNFQMQNGIVSQKIMVE